MRLVVGHPSFPSAVALDAAERWIAEICTKTSASSSGQPCSFACDRGFDLPTTTNHLTTTFAVTFPEPSGEAGSAVAPLLLPSLQPARHRAPRRHRSFFFPNPTSGGSFPPSCTSAPEAIPAWTTASSSRRLKRSRLLAPGISPTAITSSASHRMKSTTFKRRKITAFLPGFLADLLKGTPMDTAQDDLQAQMETDMAKYSVDVPDFDSMIPYTPDPLIPDPYSFRTCHKIDPEKCDYHYEVYGTKYKCEGPNKERCRPLGPHCYDEIFERMRADDPTHAADAANKDLFGDEWETPWVIRDPRVGFYQNALVVINHSYRGTKNLLFEQVRDKWMKFVRPMPVLFEKFDCTQRANEEVCRSGEVPVGEDTLALVRLVGEKLDKDKKRYVIPIKKVGKWVEFLYMVKDKGIAGALAEYLDSIDSTTATTSTTTAGEGGGSMTPEVIREYAARGANAVHIA